MQTELILRARELLGDRTPLNTDCGALCSAACCQPDEDGQGGVHLFPGEETLLADASWGRIESDAFAPMLVCDQMCDRNRRPLACRIFPLTPWQNEEGKWTVRMDARARAMCPLVRSGTKGLDPEFVKAVRKAIRLIAADPEGEAFLKRWMDLENQYRWIL